MVAWARTSSWTTHRTSTIPLTFTGSIAGQGRRGPRPSMWATSAASVSVVPGNPPCHRSRGRERGAGRSSDLTVRADIERFPGLFLQFESWGGHRSARSPRSSASTTSASPDVLHRARRAPGERRERRAAERGAPGADRQGRPRDVPGHGTAQAAGGGREKPWHQDKAFFEIDVTSPVVGVWIALDEATPDNGCMHVIPGSHLEGPRGALQPPRLPDLRH